MMIEVNKPEYTTSNVRCYKCKAEFYVHPQAGMNSAYVTDCELHNPKCEHEPSREWYTSDPPQRRCKHCGQFYR